MAGAFSKTTVNSMMLAEPPHEKQILLEVKFAEVDRTKVDQLGFNLFSTGALNTVGSLSTQQFGPPTGSGGRTDVSGTIGAQLRGTETSFSFTDILNIFLFRPDLNLGATIRALQQRNVLQILAEPNLLALNGRPARFLAGGEFPFPVVQGGTNISAVTIQFRPFGVRLEFTGFITKENAVRLQVSPEVSTLDFTNALTISGFLVPAVSTRRAETEIELKDGQSFGIAGMLDRRTQAQFSKVPGIGDIPIIGHLFRSKNLSRSRTELVVLVTPHIVDPVRAGGALPPEPKPPIPDLDIPQFDKGLPGGGAATKPEEATKPK
jgi:pilus assembly protein CpaC